MFFGNLFDFNGDGKTSPFEMATGFFMLQECLEEEREQALADSGLDRNTLLLMDEDERHQRLEDAGLDPDDYYF